MDAIPPTPEASPQGDTLLFVYGTLKRGQPNHGRLQGAQWLGQVTLEGLRLHDLGPFPMAIAGEGRVRGELYAGPWSALPALDAFEGAPRLYQRRSLPLADGRRAWVYVGQPRQVRHVRYLPDGEWPASPPLTPPPALAAGRGGMEPWALALALLAALGPVSARASAFDPLGACQSWRGSRGRARIELANAIGAAHYLTKRHPFQESRPDAPIELYSPTDIQRVCGRS